MVATDWLQEAGFKVFEACGAVEALAILHARDDVQAVLTDIEMPGGMDGLDLAATIHDTWPAIGIMLTSGRVRPNPSSMPPRADFIGKPYKSADMVAGIARLIPKGQDG